jgi:hypothetical protein
MALKALTSKRSIGIGFSKYRPSSTKFSILFYLFHLISLHFILFYFIFILFVFSKYRHYVGGGPNLAFCLKIFLGQCLYSSFQHTKNAHCISHFTKQQCYVFPKNPPGGIRTRILCSSGGRDDHCVRARLQNFTNSPVVTWVRIQKPVVTYDPVKFSVTSSAGLPNFFLNILILEL